MKAIYLEREFEKFVSKLLTTLGFEIIPEYQTRKIDYADFAILKGSLRVLCETKFFRSAQVASAHIKQSASLVKQYHDPGFPHRLLIVSNYVSNALKDEIKDQIGVVVWDRSNIANFLASKDRGEYLEDFSYLVLEAQQGLDTELPYTYVEETDSDPEQYFNVNLNVDDIYKIKKEGQEVIDRFENIPEGQAGWSKFETICEDALKVLFKNDLSVWSRQKITDDQMSRFDLICRINSKDDYWRTLVSSFHARYILFEFKNYTEQLPQAQIYLTERYLFPKALRGACLIIARNGASIQAINAAKGALRENGKLILIINLSDLIKMLQILDEGGSPNDYLSDILDDFLITLSR